MIHCRGWYLKRVQYVADAKNKVVVITGANSGAGLETVIKFAKLNAKVVVMGCRNEFKALAAIAHVKKEVPNSKTELDFV